MNNKSFTLIILFLLINLVGAASINIDWINPTSNINVSQNNFFNITVNVSCIGLDCGDMNVTLDPSGMIYNFTSCGVTGRTGPSLTNCTSSYSGTSLSGLTGVVNGIQNWTVPYTGLYTIMAVGAKGGGGGGGKGTKMQGDFQLTKGTILRILVGQRGTLGSGSGGSNNSGGGGGGTFVVSQNNSIYVIAAGGGGGNSDYGTQSSFPNNITGNSGNIGTSGSSTYSGGGGTNGRGGNSGVTDGQAAGGGGFSGNGTGGSSSGGGLSFLSGGTGGSAGTGSYPGGNGGFGGGGGGESNILVRGGGGGGYSGGQGATYQYSAPTVYGSSNAIDKGFGGGGGSVNNGTNQNNTAAFNSGDGYVTITFTGGSKSGTVSNNIGEIPYYTTVTNPYNLSISNGQSQQIVWLLNATGIISIASEFYVYANLTSNRSNTNASSRLNITIIDTTPPTISIVYPTSIIYSANVGSINYTHSDTNPGYCWYSFDNGVTNSSNVIAGTNFTNLTSVEGTNLWTLYCNDSSGNLNSNSITFTKSTPTIGLNLISPTGNINVTQNQTFTVSVNVSCPNGNCDEINVSLDPQSTSYNFTACGASGKTGPTQANCNTNYTGTSLSGLVGVSNGIQNFTIPATGVYTIEAIGAAGGCIGGGNGTKMIGTFTLSAGTVLQILVGQSGGCISYGGGGGGTFVANGSNYATSTPLIVAGAGGGTSSGSSNGLDAITGINGTDGKGMVGNKGTNGNGGGKGSGYAGAGGGGFYGNGTAGYYSNSGGNAFIYGGNGGTKGTYGGEGGFGGGGANGWWGGGGGGGYSGGGGGATDNYAGGGGGSYNSGTNQNNTVSTKNGDGYVTITSLTSTKSGLVSTNTNATPFYTTTRNPYNLSLNTSQSQIISWTVNATGSINGTHKFFVYANKTSDMSIGNTTLSWNVTIVGFATDSIYPSFTSYGDNSGSLSDSGTGTFNVTLSNTNGTVLLEINNTNITATTLSENRYSAQYLFTFPGIYSYKWHSWGNGTSTQYNKSETRTYTIIDSCIPSLTNTSWSSWQNQSVCTINDLQLQNRTRIQYDSNSCNEVSNITIREYQNISCNYCSYIVANTSWGSWTNISCLQTNMMNQSRNLTQYDSNYNLCYSITHLTSDLWNSGSNMTFFDYQNVESCNYSISVSLISPSTNYQKDSDLENITFNCSTNSVSSISNISLYLTNNQNNNFVLNKTSQLSGTLNSSNWTIGLATGNYTWNCRAYDTAGNNIFAPSNKTIYIGIIDGDIDGIRNSLDNLNGNNSNVNKQGISNLNIIIGNTTNITTFNNTQEVAFYDSSRKIMNFTFNFSQSKLDLNNVTIIKDTNYLIINLSQQLQANYNKTIYLTNNNFAFLCAKDSEIDSINEMSSDCTKENETDLTSCLGNSTGITKNGINCSDDGTTISISNLRYSAVRGTQSATSTTPQNNTPSGGGGGGSTTIVKKECEKESECKQGYSCYNNKCVKLFDVEIKQLDALAENLSFPLTYLIKGMAEIKGDVIIKFWIKDNNQKITMLGQDAIYLDAFEEKTKTTNLNLPRTISNGDYDLYVQINFENYQAESFRKINIDLKEGIRLSPEQTEQPSPNKSYAWYAYIGWIVFIVMFILILARSRSYIIKPFNYLKTNKENIYNLLKRKESTPKEDQGKTDNKIETRHLERFVINPLKKTRKIHNHDCLDIQEGKQVYSSDGNFIGEISQAMIQDKKIYGWLINTNTKYNLKQKILIKHQNVRAIGDVFIIDKEIEEYLEKIKNKII